MQKQLIIVGIVLLLVVAGVYYYFTQYQSSGDEESAELNQIEGSGSFGGELFEQSGNPAQNVPDINPFQDVNTNPLEGINPFGSGYRNPFE